jgi:hypothetical protein
MRWLPVYRFVEIHKGGLVSYLADERVAFWIVEALCSFSRGPGTRTVSSSPSIKTHLSSASCVLHQLSFKRQAIARCLELRVLNAAQLHRLCDHCVVSSVEL